MTGDMKDGWYVSLPNGWNIAGTFEEAMEKWFEGYNPPRLVLHGVMEDCEVSLARVKAHYAKPKHSDVFCSGCGAADGFHHKSGCREIGT